MMLVLALVLSTAVPRYERVPCAAEVAADERIECGALFVPENRARKDARTIRLPVMIFRSRAEKPAPDPLVFKAIEIRALAPDAAPDLWR